MAARLKTDTVKVLQEKGVSAAEMEAQLRQFLRRRGVAEGLSKNQYSRLQGLHEALRQEGKEEGVAAQALGEK